MLRARTVVLLTTAIVAATAVADARLRVTVAADARVTVVVDVPLPVAVVVGIRRRVADPRTAADRRTVVAVAAADMEGNTTLDSFPA